ncbi:uncharacterized protein LDX57_012389 [Aspergillus melleus]|uniref:uncharacterized protein n=1 Tax=Aspergillus melleus TaxID=138277 RepID=UPI001E8CD6EB|nr:uncharacterized protein LDX57_012389 [Aspergillus melleus]KAH8434754.1 hypothetical protein LDX57_012389 [Aspergillus melleus]
MAPVSSDPEPSATFAGAESEREHGTFNKQLDRTPAHPIPQLQGPFEESMLEALEGAQSEWAVELDAQSRRKDLLESAEYERLCGRKWRQRAGERYHPFWKLISQMSFGVSLLTKRLAKSDLEVLKILQAHVDEMDGFLGRTTEDFLLIQVDVRTRIQYLNLPLGNLDVFDEMLNDRQFRRAMIGYNEMIEHAVDRFTQSVRDTLKDIQKGKAAVGALWQYLGDSARQNAPLSNNTTAVYNAMLANTEGWNAAFSKLRRKGVALESALLQLGLTITEMQRRVGVASRKEVVSLMRSSNAAPGGKRLRDRLFERGLSIRVSTPSIPEKPLPCDPGLPVATNMPPVPRQTDPRRMLQKSVPNLRASKSSDNCYRNKTPPGRSRSVNGFVNTANSIISISNLRRSSSRFSKVKPTLRESQNEGDGVAPMRPSTAPSRTLKARSASVEQLKGLYKNRKDQQQHMSMLPESRRPLTAQASSRGETMKEQLLQYFKGDRVIDAWESRPQQEKMASQDCQTKGDLWSRFRDKSSNGPGNPDDQPTNLLDEDLGRQMAWLQEETKTLNTYSLKSRRDVAPRIHVLSDPVSLARGLEEASGSRHQDDIDSPEGDTQSIITALPSVPPSLAHQN